MMVLLFFLVFLDLKDGDTRKILVAAGGRVSSVEFILLLVFEDIYIISKPKSGYKKEAKVKIAKCYVLFRI